MPSLLEITGVSQQVALNAACFPGSFEHRSLAKRLLDLAGGEPHPYPTLMLQLRRVFSQHNVLQGSPVSEMDPGLEEVRRSAIFELLPIWCATARWGCQGYPVLDLTDDYFHAIAATDFGELGDEPMRLPFEDFVIRFPENTVLGGARSVFVYNIHKFEEETDEDGLPGLKITIGHKKRASLGQLPSGERLWTQWNAEPPMNKFMHHAPNPRFMGEQAFASERSTDILAMLRHVIGNTSLYIGASGGLPPAGRKHPHGAMAEPIEREHAELPRFRVGRPIKLGPQMRAAVGQRNTSAWKLAARFVVRGHWRNQAYGPQRSLRTKKWIQPFWKGPKTLTEALERTYEVD